MGLRILVTGSSGYIGAVMAPRLVDAGHDVIGLDLGLYDDSAFSSGAPEPDMRDLRELTPGDVEEFDAVVCLAALSNDPIGNLDEDLTYAINHRATVDLAKLAKDAGVERFLFASSCSLYGASGGAFVDEDGAFAPVTAYGQSKVLVEQELASLADDSFSPTYLRNATVYGVSPSLRLDVVVNNLTAWAVATGRIVLISDGTPWRPQVHIEDVCLAFEAVLNAQRDSIHNQAFNVGRTAENFQVREIAEMVGDRFPDATLVIPESSGPDTRSYRVDFSKAEDSLIGYEPSWTVRKGIDQLADAFEAAEMKESDFPRYTRLAEVERRIQRGELDNSLRWI